MSEEELRELVSKNVRETFLANGEMIAKLGIELTRHLYPSNLGDLCDLYRSMADYVVNISEVTCLAMATALSDAGVLDVHQD